MQTVLAVSMLASVRCQSTKTAKQDYNIMDDEHTMESDA